MNQENKHKEPKLWDRLYAKSDRSKIIESLNYGFRNPKVFYYYYCWLNMIARNKLKFKKSLEVGSGTGSYSLILKKFGIVDEVYLLDYSKESLKIAKNNFKKYGEKGHFILGDAFKLPFKDNFFDLTISGGLIEHFSREDAMKILKEKTRVSKYILTQVPINTPAYWLLRSIVTLKNFGWPFGYEKPIKVGLLKRMYEDSGIKIIDKEYHDILTSFKFSRAHETNKNLNLKKGFINRIFANEIAVLGKKIF